MRFGNIDDGNRDYTEYYPGEDVLAAARYQALAQWRSTQLRAPGTRRAALTLTLVRPPTPTPMFDATRFPRIFPTGTFQHNIGFVLHHRSTIAPLRKRCTSYGLVV
jgi:hypothetical protein